MAWVTPREEIRLFYSEHSLGYSLYMLQYTLQTGSNEVGEIQTGKATGELCRDMHNKKIWE